jgi:H/ACA ribonucleoprotein complex non-core subunit NAF1
MDAAAKVTEPERVAPAAAMSVETNGSSSETCEQLSAEASVVVPASMPVKEAGDADEAMKEDAESEDSESEDESDDSDDDGEEEEAPRKTPTDVALTDASGRPLSDIEIAAQYAAIEIQSISSQFATAAVVDPSTPAPAPIVPSASNGNGAPLNTVVNEEANGKTDEPATAGGEDSSGDDDSSDEDEGEDDPRKLRAEIEAAMEKEENKVSGPLKTVNEVAAVPVREPAVRELTPDCPIARCGTILNVSRPGLIVTIKSDHGVKPLDEGSVFCLEDRTVLGCVDEVFGPVLMPMYLVRFESADKIPAQTEVNKPVFYATEHTTYLVPENIRDKGTDASNIFDEETDETVFSDDEAEAAAKRQNRKRNRGGENAGTPVDVGSGPAGNFSDYQGGGGRHHGGGSRGRGRGRGGRGSNGHGQPQHHQSHYHSHAASVQIQAQPHGGVTRYTTPGYGQPGGGHGYPPAPGQYQQPPHGTSQYGGFPQGQYGHAPPPPPQSVPMYGQPSYATPQPLPPYPPQAPPPNYYGQPPHQPHGQYAQPPPPLPQSGHYGPSTGYYQQPPAPYAYSQQPQQGPNQHPFPPPPPSGGSYGPQGRPHH